MQGRPRTSGARLEGTAHLLDGQLLERRLQALELGGSGLASLGGGELDGSRLGEPLLRLLHLLQTFSSACCFCFC